MHNIFFPEILKEFNSKPSVINPFAVYNLCVRMPIQDDIKTVSNFAPIFKTKVKLLSWNYSTHYCDLEFLRNVFFIFKCTFIDNN